MLDSDELDDVVSEFSNQDGLTNAPNITKALGVVRMGEKLLLVMDKVEGPPMDKVFSETSFRGTPQERLSSALHVFSGMAKALASMHARGVAHLDIKPRNTMYNPSSGEAQLIDFGLMKRNGVPSDGKGTAPFMAPEFREGRPVHTGSDIWALGASLADQAGIPLFEGMEDGDAVLGTH